MVKRKRGLGRVLRVLLVAMLTWATPVLGDDMSARLKAIYAMQPETMAATGVFTSGAWERLLGHAYSIEKPSLRQLVLEMILKPESKAFGKSAHQSFATAPGGETGHHIYPGGLAVHTLELLEVGLAWADAIERIYGVECDRDIVIASLVLHDWSKIWHHFDTTRGVVTTPEWWPAAWGKKALWPWMGGHGAVVYAELIIRDAPLELIAGAAAAHFDPALHLSGPNESLNAALAEAAEIVGRPAPMVDRNARMAEWWIATYTDTAFSYSTLVAAPVAQKATDAVIKQLGVQAGSREAGLLSWYVLTRVSDFQLYEAYQKGGYKQKTAEELVWSVLKSPQDYSVLAATKQ